MSKKNIHGIMKLVRLILRYGDGMTSMIRGEAQGNQMDKKPRLIIGFSGKRGVGKTAASVYLARKYGFHTISFAASLKEKAKLFFPFTPSDLSEKGKEKPYKNYDWTPRDFIISVGKMARFYDPDYWVNNSPLETQQGDISIDDVRFPNECEKIKSMGGKVVRIERFEKLNIYGKNLDDASETSLDNYKGFDYTIDACRNVALQDLHDRLDYMMELFDGEEGESN